MNDKNPHSSWFWNDHDNEPGLRLCSLAAHGLWMRLLAIAARSPEHGIVQIGDQPSTLETVLPFIARGTAETVETVRALIDELLTSGTASLDRKGRIYCRRMVRDAGLSKKRSESGKKGAEVTNGNNKRNERLARQKRSKPPDKDAASSVFSLPASEEVDRPSPEPAREDEADDWPAENQDGGAVLARQPSDHRSGGQRYAGDVLDRFLVKTGPVEKRKKLQSRADQDMVRHLTSHCGMDTARAWSLVMAARDDDDADHTEAARELEKISARHKLGFFVEEPA